MRSFVKHPATRRFLAVGISIVFAGSSWSSVAIACEGGGEEKPAPLTASSDPLRFGLVDENTTAEKSITFTANEEVKIEKKITPPGAPFGEGMTNTCNNKLLKATNTCVYAVTFTPKDKKSHTETLSFHYEIVSNSKVETESVLLEGTGN